MNLEDALYRALTGGEDRADEKAPLLDRIADIAEHAGSWKAAAGLIGVNDSTLRKWRRGAAGGRGIRNPKAASVGRVPHAQRRARMSEERERYLRGNTWGASFHFVGNVTISNDERERDLDGDDIDTDSVSLDAVIDAWLDLDDQAAAHAFGELLAEGYFNLSDDGASVEVGDVETLEFGDE